MNTFIQNLPQLQIQSLCNTRRILWHYLSLLNYTRFQVLQQPDRKWRAVYRFTKKETLTLESEYSKTAENRTKTELYPPQRIGQPFSHCMQLCSDTYMYNMQLQCIAFISVWICVSRLFMSHTFLPTHVYKVRASECGLCEPLVMNAA